MPERVLVTGYTWVDGVVHLRARHLPGGEPHTRPLEGAVCIRVLPGRFCTGYSDGSVVQPCPDASAAVRGSQCEPCQSRDAFRVCMMCDGFRCPRLSKPMREYCQQDHHLYLACFGEDRIKVGTASHPRRTQRIIEQGPLAAARVARGPGPKIKQMENRLSEAGYTETMRRDRKTALLQGAMTEVQARSLVLEASKGVRAELHPRYHKHLHAPVVVTQPELARASRGMAVQQLTIADDRVVEGRVVGAVGHVLFVEESDGRFALDLGALKARRIEFDPAGPRRKAEAQLGLF